MQGTCLGDGFHEGWPNVVQQLLHIRFGGTTYALFCSQIGRPQQLTQDLDRTNPHLLVEVEAQQRHNYAGDLVTLQRSSAHYFAGRWTYSLDALKAAELTGPLVLTILNTFYMSDTPEDHLSRPGTAGKMDNLARGLTMPFWWRLGLGRPEPRTGRSPP